MGDIVENSDGEVVLGRRPGHFVKHALDHTWCEFFGREAISPTNHARHRDKLRCAVARALSDCSDDILVERLTGSAGFLGAVESGDGFHRGRECPDKIVDGEGTEKTNF